MSRQEAIKVAMRRRKTLPEKPDFSGVPDDAEWQKWVIAQDWWMRRMMTSKNPFEEKQTLMWHYHFAVGYRKVEKMQSVIDQQFLIRKRGYGNFRNLLHGVSLSPATLVYLDNATNVRGAIQENFARELMELYTIGPDAFTETDVVSMAQAWTGHNIVGYYKDPVTGVWDLDQSYKFWPERHDNSKTELFGKTKRWNPKKTINELVRQSKKHDTALFVAKRIFEFYAYENPEPEILERLAKVFKENRYFTRAVVKAVLNSDEFWSPRARWAQVKSPVEFAVGVLHAYGMDPSEAGLSWNMYHMGQRLFEPPSVAGWGQNEDWLSTATSWGRARFVNHVHWTANGGPFTGLAERDPDDAVDLILNKFRIYQLPDQTREELTDWFIATRSEAPWSLPRNAALIGALLPEAQVM